MSGGACGGVETCPASHSCLAPAPEPALRRGTSHASSSQSSAGVGVELVLGPPTAGASVGIPPIGAGFGAVAADSTTAALGAGELIVDGRVLEGTGPDAPDFGVGWKVGASARRDRALRGAMVERSA